MSNTQYHQQKRKYERVHIDQPAKIKQGMYDDDIFLFDISLKGVCFSLPSSFQLTTEHSCTLNFEAKQGPKKKCIEMKLDIVRKKENKVGATWTEIDISSLKNLASLLEHYTQTSISLDDIQL